MHGSMATLGEFNPDLVEKLGVNGDKELLVVTFRDPHYEPNGRRDPVADLPPDYDRYGIVDRSHRHRVESGQTWVVQPVSPKGTAVFLVPVCEVDLAAILALDVGVQASLARDLVLNRPDLVEALADLLPEGAQKTDSREVEVLRRALADSHAALAKVSALLQDLRNQNARVVDEAVEAASQAMGMISKAPIPAGDEPRIAQKKLPLFVADANIFINAERWKWPNCNRILDAAGSRFRLATTRAVYEELTHSYRLPKDLVVLEVGEIDERLYDLAGANASATGKKAGENDLSLIQAVLDNEEVRGIITEDPDVTNIHPASLVKSLTGRDVECLRAEEFCQRHKKLVLERHA